MPVTRSGDADIAYQVDGRGEPVLMIQGLGAVSEMWLMQKPAFAERHRTITFDNRGVGRSSSPPGPYTTAQMAADALAVLDAAGAERAHVVGVSLGGAIAQQLVLKAPERVRSLVLAGTWCARNNYTERLEAFGRLVLDNLGREAFLRATILWLFTPRFILDRPEMVATIEQMMLEFQPSDEGFRAQRDAVLEHDVRRQLSSVNVPTLVVTGARDILVPPELSEHIVDAIPGAELAVLQAGHAFIIEEAEAFNSRVLEFLAAN